MLVQGVSIWTFAYCLIYPVYAVVFGSLKAKLPAASVGGGSFGRFLFICDRPAARSARLLCFSPKVTLIYIVMGLKTSLVQGLLSALEAAVSVGSAD